MKLEFGEYQKGMSPAHAAIDIKVVELGDKEKFDKPTLEKVVKRIVENDQPKYDKMKFDTFSSFFGVFNFSYNDEKIKIIEYPIFCSK